MSRETLAEVLCNLEGSDPNNSANWERNLLDADAQLLDAANGVEGADWWNAA